MAKKFLSPLNLLNLTSDPGTAAEGDFYWNSSTNRLRIYFDGAWADVSSNTVFTNQANTFTVSPQQITIDNAANKGFIVKAASSQSANLQEWQDSAGSTLGYVNSVGDLVLPTKLFGSRYGRFGSDTAFTDQTTLKVSAYSTSTPTAVIKSIASQTANILEVQNSTGGLIFAVSPLAEVISYRRLSVISPSATTTALIVRNAASQTADIQLWTNSSATILGGANALAQIYTGSTTPILATTGGATTAASGDGTTATITTTSAHGLAVGDLVTIAGVTPTGYNGTFLITAVTSTTISYANTTTGAQTIAGTISVPAQSSITTRSAGTVGLIIKSAASQISNLQEWQNSSGTVLTNIDSTGRIVSTIGLYTTSKISVGGASWSGGSGNLNVFATSTSNPTVVVRAVSSQTSNLQEWQNNAGTALSAVTTSGRIWAAGVTVASNGAVSSGSQFGVVISSASSIGEVIRGAASQTANLTEWQDNSGTVLSAITSNGNMAIGRSSNLGSASFTIQSVTPISLFSTDNTTALHNRIIFLRGNSTGNSMSITSKGDTANGVGALVISTGAFTTEITGFGYNGNIYTNIQSASTVGLTVKAASSQTANLQEWQGSSGTILNRILSDGSNYSSAAIHWIGYNRAADGAANYNFTTVSGATSSQAQIARGSGYNGALQLTNYGNSTILLTNGQAGSVVATVRGYASQSANLTEWQDSAGTVLASISSTGEFTIPSLTVSGDLTVNGTTTNINTTNLVIEDKNIILGDVATPSNTTADGGGITLKGATDKTFNWVNSTGAWTSSEPIIANSFIPTSSTVPTNGMYLPAANTIGFASNSALRMIINSTGKLVYGHTATEGEWYMPSGTAHKIYIVDNVSTNTAGGNMWISRHNGTPGITIARSNGTNIGDRGIVAAGDVLGAVQFAADDGTTASYSRVGRIQVVADGTIGVDQIPSYMSFLVGATSGGLDTEWMRLNYSGSLGLGTTTHATNVGLYARRNLSGSVNSYGIISDGQVQSDVTTKAVQFYSSARTANAIFTLSSFYHFEAAQSTLSNITAGGALTNQVGYFVDSTLTGATNNYGFRGSIASGANRWNAYMDGTAANYFAGQTNIGSTSLTLGAGSVAQQFGVVPSATTTVGIVVQGAASQTADLQQWQNSTGSVLAKIQASGTALLYNNARVYASSAAAIPFFVQGYASQTANLQEWQQSDASVPTAIDNSGKLRVRTFGYMAGASLDVSTASSGSAGIIVKGVASQIANLQEWQNSGGTILAKVDANGNFSAISKSFDIPHPTKENMRLRHGSLEGPENGVYVRGNTKNKVIELPDYWTGLVDESTITVTLTSIGKFQKVYVEKIESNKVYIGGRVKEISYVVFGERKDIDKITVEY